jgi:hypothetical protein
MKAALLMIVHNHSQNMTFASYEIWHETYVKHAPLCNFRSWIGLLNGNLPLIYVVVSTKFNLKILISMCHICQQAHPKNSGSSSIRVKCGSGINRKFVTNMVNFLYQFARVALHFLWRRNYRLPTHCTVWYCDAYLCLDKVWGNNHTQGISNMVLWWGSLFVYRCWVKCTCENLLHSSWLR